MLFPAVQSSSFSIEIDSLSDEQVHLFSSSILPSSLELIHKSMNLKYEPTSKPLHASAKQLFLN